MNIIEFAQNNGGFICASAIILVLLIAVVAIGIFSPKPPKGGNNE